MFVFCNIKKLSPLFKKDCLMSIQTNKPKGYENKKYSTSQKDWF